mgnify:CR=1 FL=1
MGFSRNDLKKLRIICNELEESCKTDSTEEGELAERKVMGLLQGRTEEEQEQTLTWLDTRTFRATLTPIIYDKNLMLMAYGILFGTSIFLYLVASQIAPEYALWFKIVSFSVSFIAALLFIKFGYDNRNVKKWSEHLLRVVVEEERRRKSE